jgi:ketol-acid reductoisomerase
MRALISDTAKWGELTVGRRIVNDAVQKRMAAALADIRSGKFAREFLREMNSGRRRYMKLLRQGEKHPIETVGRRLRGLMSWKTKSH